MTVPGLDPATIVLLVGFGAMVGVLFGCFGMGGSLLVTPALLIVGYPAQVAVGSGLAFVCGTSVVSGLRHRAFGQIDYRLAGVMVIGMTLGIEAGTRLIFRLEAIGAVDVVVSMAYVVLLGLAGIGTLWRARREEDGRPNGAFVDYVERVRLPPRMHVAGGHEVSLWVILGVGGAVGILSGVLGVGGGFLLLPVLVYGLGVPVTVAVGTDILQIAVASSYGAFVYATAGAIALPAVGAMLAGSILGARIGASASVLVDGDALMGAFGVLLVAGSLSVAANELGRTFDFAALHLVSIVLVFGAPAIVCGLVGLAIVSSRRRRTRDTTRSSAPGHP